MKSVLIGGIGNVLLGDDGVGPYVVRLLAARYNFENGVEVIDLGTPALDLIDQISGKDAVILIDSIKSDLPPGAVQFYRKEDLIRYRPQVRMDPHSPALGESILSAEMFGVSPKSLLLIGIVGESYDSGCNLSEAVNVSINPVIDEVLRELDRADVKYEARQCPADPEIWWAEDLTCGASALAR